MIKIKYTFLLKKINSIINEIEDKIKFIDIRIKRNEERQNIMMINILNRERIEFEKTLEYVHKILEQLKEQ